MSNNASALVSLSVDDAREALKILFKKTKVKEKDFNKEFGFAKSILPNFRNHSFTATVLFSKDKPDDKFTHLQIAEIISNYFNSHPEHIPLLKELPPSDLAPILCTYCMKEARRNKTLFDVDDNDKPYCNEKCREDGYKEREDNERKMYYQSPIGCEHCFKQISYEDWECGSYVLENGNIYCNEGCCDLGIENKEKENYNLNPLKCDCCNKQFTFQEWVKDMYETKNDGKFYCNLTCLDSTELHQRIKDCPSCKHCNKPFNAKDWDSDFCGKDCFKANKEGMIIKKLVITCTHCFKNITNKSNVFDDDKFPFCDMKCLTDNNGESFCAGCDETCERNDAYVEGSSQFCKECWDQDISTLLCVICSNHIENKEQVDKYGAPYCNKCWNDKIPSGKTMRDEDTQLLKEMEELKDKIDNKIEQIIDNHGNPRSPSSPCIDGIWARDSLTSKFNFPGETFIQTKSDNKWHLGSKYKRKFEKLEELTNDKVENSIVLTVEQGRKIIPIIFKRKHITFEELGKSLNKSSHEIWSFVNNDNKPIINKYQNDYPPRTFDEIMLSSLHSWINQNSDVIILIKAWLINNSKCEHDFKEVSEEYFDACKGTCFHKYVQCTICKVPNNEWNINTKCKPHCE